ncbi:MAG: rhomboid family intramembrane serine protease [Chloroflexi bacterium]|nr:rhomboid family intramembrane serine protease [Chloroflexota bacterium]
MLALIVANIAVFLYQLNLNSRALSHFVYSYALIPFEVTNNVDLPPPGPDPIYLTLFSSMFMHSGFLHIAGNMLYLWVFGDNVEDGLGHLRFTLLYFLSGLAAAGTQIWVSPDSTIPTIGASGAIAGILGAYLVMYPGAPIRVLVFLGPFITIARLSAFLMIGYWAVVQLFSGVGSLGVETGGVAYWAHIGGFGAGLVLAPLMRSRRAWA